MQCHFHQVLRTCPPLYRVWHAYRYTIAQLHRTHFPLFTYLQRGTLAEGTQVPTTTRTRSMELLLAALLRLPLSERSAIRSRLNWLRWRLAVVGITRRADWPQARLDRPGRLDAVMEALRTRITILAALDALLRDWIPAVLVAGFKVRNCTWAGGARGSGAEAKETLMACLLLLLRLTDGTSHHVEYVRTLVSALLVWRDWHSALPACCFTDEVCEASLASFGSLWADHPEVQDAAAAEDMFLLLPPTSSAPHDLPPKNCPNSLATKVRRRIRLLTGRTSPLPPYVSWLPQGRKSTVRPQWPANPWFPPSVRVPPDPQYLRDLITYIISTLVQQPHPSPNVLHALQTYNFPLRDVTNAYRLQSAAKSLIRTPARFRRHVARRPALVPTGPPVPAPLPHARAQGIDEESDLAL